MKTEGTEKNFWYVVFRTWSRFGDRRIFYKKAVGLHRLAAAFACLGLSVCCAQPGSAVIPNRRLIMMLRFRTSEQHMLQIRRAV